MNSSINSPKLVLEVSLEQADAIREALDLYTRMQLGQLVAITNLVSSGTIPLCVDNATLDIKPGLPDCEVVDQIDSHVSSIKKLIGFKGNGISRGLGHPHLPLSGARSYEIKKVIDKALALHKNPNPAMRGVHYDGLSLRYTKDVAPVASIVPCNSNKHTSNQ